MSELLLVADDMDWSEWVESARRAAVAPTMAQSPASMAAFRSSRETLPEGREWLAYLERGEVRQRSPMESVEVLESFGSSTGMKEGLGREFMWQGNGSK